MLLLLLPPSEAKTPGGDGPPVGACPELSTPDLAEPRAVLMGAIRRAADRRTTALATGLKLPPGVAAEALVADRQVATAPTRPALDRYAGVVFASLDAPTLTAAARRRAESTATATTGAPASIESLLRSQRYLSRPHSQPRSSGGQPSSSVAAPSNAFSSIFAAANPIRAT